LECTLLVTKKAFTLYSITIPGRELTVNSANAELVAALIRGFNYLYKTVFIR